MFTDDCTVHLCTCQSNVSRQQLTPTAAILASPKPQTVELASSPSHDRCILL